MIFSSARLSCSVLRCAGPVGCVFELNIDIQLFHNTFIVDFLFMLSSFPRAWSCLGGDRTLPNAREFLHSTRFTHVRCSMGLRKLSRNFCWDFFSRAQRREKRERAEYLLSLCCCQHFLSSSTHPIPFLSVSLRWPPFFASSWDCVCTRLKRVELDVLFKLPTLHTYGITITVLKLDETHLGKMRTSRMSRMSVWKFNPRPDRMELSSSRAHKYHCRCFVLAPERRKVRVFFLRKEHGNFSSEQQISCTR